MKEFTYVIRKSIFPIQNSICIWFCWMIGIINCVNVFMYYIVRVTVVASRTSTDPQTFFSCLSPCNGGATCINAVEYVRSHQRLSLYTPLPCFYSTFVSFFLGSIPFFSVLKVIVQRARVFWKRFVCRWIRYMDMS